MSNALKFVLTINIPPMLFTPSELIPTSVKHNDDNENTAFPSPGFVILLFHLGSMKLMWNSFEEIDTDVLLLHLLFYSLGIYRCEKKRTSFSFLVRKNPTLQIQFSQKRIDHQCFTNSGCSNRCHIIFCKILIVYKKKLVFHAVLVK